MGEGGPAAVNDHHPTEKRAACYIYIFFNKDGIFHVTHGRAGGEGVRCPDGDRPRKGTDCWLLSDLSKIPTKRARNGDVQHPDAILFRLCVCVCRRAMLYKATGQRQTGWIVVLAMLCSSTNDPAVCYVASGGGGNASGYNLVHPNVSYANSGGCGSAAQHHHDYGYPRAEVTNSFVQDLDCSIHSSAVAAVAAAAAAAAAISNYHHQHGPNPVSSSAIHPAGTAGGGSNIKKFWEHPAHPAGPQAKKSDAAAAAAAKSSQNNR